jgi:hypothetical protein
MCGFYIAIQWRLTIFGPHIDDGGCVVYVWFLYCHTMKIKADHIWSIHWWWRVCSLFVVSILPYNEGASLHCVAIYKPHIHYTPSIVNERTKYGQPSLYGNLETTHTLYTLHRQCVDQIWSAFIVWQYRNHTYTTHPPSSMYGPNMVSLNLHWCGF